MQCLHLLLFGVRIDALHDLFGLVPAALHGQPPRGVRHVGHADRQRDPGDDRGGEHRSPAPTCREEDVVQHVGDEDPAGDRELLEDHQSATDLPGRQLSDVGGDDHRRRADSDPDDDPEHNEEQQAGRQRGRDCSERVDASQCQQRIAAADAVGQLAAEDPADDRADQHRRHGQFLGAGTEIPVRLEEVLGSRNDTDVIAEQHASDRRDARHQVGISRRGTDDVPTK